MYLLWLLPYYTDKASVKSLYLFLILSLFAGCDFSILDKEVSISYATTSLSTCSTVSTLPTKEVNLDHCFDQTKISTISKVSGCESEIDNNQIIANSPISECQVTVEGELKNQSPFKDTITIKTNWIPKRLGKTNTTYSTAFSKALIKSDQFYWLLTNSTLMKTDLSFNLVESYSFEDGLIIGQFSDLIIDNSVIYVFGEEGVSISKDQGSSWSNIPLSFSNGVNVSIYSVAKINDYLIGRSTTKDVFRCHITTWDCIYFEDVDPNIFPFETHSNSDVVTINNIIYVPTKNGLYYSEDGLSWNRYTDSVLPNNHCSAVYLDNGVLYVATNSGLATFDGTTWSSLNPSSGSGTYTENNLVSVAASGSTILATAFKSVGISLDGGSSYEPPTDPPVTHEDWYQIYNFYIDASTIVLGGNRGFIYSQDNGTTWNHLVSPGSLSFSSHSTFHIHSDTVFLPTWGNGLYRADINDLQEGQWTRQTFPFTTPRGHSFFFRDTIETFDSSTIGVHEWSSGGYNISTDNGLTWSLIDTTVNGGPNYFYGTDYYNGVFYGGGHNTGIGMSSDLGSTWTVLQTGDGFPHNKVNNVYVDKKNEILYISTDAGLVRSSLDLTTYEVIASASYSTEALNTGKIIECHNVIYVTTSETIAYSTDNGQSFKHYTGTSSSIVDTSCVNGTFFAFYKFDSNGGKTGIAQTRDSITWEKDDWSKLKTPSRIYSIQGYQEDIYILYPGHFGKL